MRRRHPTLPRVLAHALLASPSLALAPRPARLAGLAALALRSVPLVAAQAPAGGGGTGSNSSSVACGWASACPKESPCCSEYGYCAAGTSCLGGCNPQGSYGEGYCAPLPVCSSANYTFADESRIQMNHSAWMGDADKYDFTLDKLDGSNPALVQDGNLVLTLTEDGGGTRISTTRNVLYGTIQASIKTVGAAGVVTAFITMSGVKDEIDFEWTTNNTNEVQSNWYWEGDVDDYTHGGSHTARNRASDGIQWTPTQLDWLVGGKSVRTVKKSDDKNGRYPQTPSRVQFSVWPAGIKGTSEGTITWAGGLIDWTSPAYTANNAFQAEVAWLSIDCYDGLDLPFVAGNSSSASSNSSSSRLARRDEDESVEALWKRQSGNLVSYLWGTNDTNGQIGVDGSDRATVINSPYSTGQNMLVKNGDTKGVKGTKASGSGSSVFGDNAFGNWWSRQSTAVHAGLIVGVCAAALFLLVVLCTLWARRKDRGKARKRKEAALLAASSGGAGAGAGAAANARRAAGGRKGPDAIPLVGTGAGSSSRVDLPGQFARPGYARGGADEGSYYGDAASVSSSMHKGSFRAASPYGDGSRAGTPPVPSVPAQYQQQYQQPGYGAYPPAYGAPQPQFQQGYGGGYGGGQQQQQGWGGYGQGRY
ncbi:putative glycosidase CRH2 [Rhodotorula kratochvilovae]